MRDLFKYTVLRSLADVLPEDSCSSLQSLPNFGSTKVEYPDPVVAIVPSAVTIIGVNDAGVSALVYAK